MAGDTTTRATTPPDGYFLIPRKVVFVLVALAAYIAVALTVLIVVVNSNIGTDNGQDQRIAKVARQTRKLTIQNRAALCGLRADLKQRVATSTAFLREHPNGLPEFDVSPASIRESVRNQRRTIAALAPLTCPD